MTWEVGQQGHTSQTLQKKKKKKKIIKPHLYDTLGKVGCCSDSYQLWAEFQLLRQSSDTRFQKFSLSAFCHQFIQAEMCPCDAAGF